MLETLACEGPPYSEVNTTGETPVLSRIRSEHRNLSRSADSVLNKSDIAEIKTDISSTVIKALSTEFDSMFNRINILSDRVTNNQLNMKSYVKGVMSAELKPRDLQITELCQTVEKLKAEMVKMQQNLDTRVEKKIDS